MHSHHITPKYIWKKLYKSLDGCNDPDNLIELSVSQHAAWHYELWVYYGYMEDYIAWCGLSRAAAHEEIIKFKQILGGKKGKGRKHKPKSSETRKKLSEVNKGNKNCLGKKHTNETKEKMSTSHKGKKLTIEHKQKLSTLYKGVPLSDERKNNMSQKWIVISPYGENEVITNLRQFCRDNKLTATLMYSVANGKNKQHKGWKVFKYE